MTDDEVELIYEYLHANYEYRYGDLIAKVNRGKKKAGDKLGWFVGHDCGLAYMNSELVINKKRMNKPVSHFVFIYHNKKIPKFINHIDGNRMNCKIENLIEVKAPCNKKLYAHKNKKPKGFSITRNNKFQVCYMGANKKYTVGAYDDKDLALRAYLYWEDLIEIKKQDIEESMSLVIKKYPLPIRNKHGYKGIYKVKDKYRAKCGKTDIGPFKTPEEAHAAYLKAKHDHV